MFFSLLTSLKTLNKRSYSQILRLVNSENNIAANNHPIGVLGGEQRFDFPSLYFAQKDANTLIATLSMDDFEKKKRNLTKDISKAFYNVIYLQNVAKQYRSVDSLYFRFSEGSEISYKVGNISYVEMLNARSKHNQVRILKNQIQHDIDIAMSGIAALMHYDSVFTVPCEMLEKLEVTPGGIETTPGLQYLQHAIQYQDAALRVEKNKLLPDLSLSYFNGTNKYAGKENYQGFQVGVGIPLKDHYIRIYNNKVAQMMTGLEKYSESITYYEQTGKQLSAELIRNAQMSHVAGEIDFFRFVQSVENAVAIELNYLENLSMYNELVLEINFL